MDDVIAAAKKACCHEFIMGLPDGYETVVGEGGATLSGGEKQRIAIARAIMKNAPIIILDEATANVDPENEKELTQAIENLTRDKTIIMIAHRLKAVRHADQIVVIDKGKIVQQGKHDDLMEQDGIYKNFVNERKQAVSWKVEKAIALKQLPLGTAYAIWTGMGIVGTSVLGVFLFQEKLTVPQVICVMLIVVGIAGLKILAKE